MRDNKTKNNLYSSWFDNRAKGLITIDPGLLSFTICNQTHLISLKGAMCLIFLPI